MDLFKLIQDLKSKNINLSVSDGKLKTSAPKGAITPELADNIRQNKDQLIQLLQRVEKNELDQHKIAKAPTQDCYPLSYSQQRLWFIDQLDGNSSQYNLSYALGVKGQLDEAALQYALNTIVERHEVLRTTFFMQGEQPMQRVSSEHRLDITHTDLRAEPESALQDIIEQESNLPFDLAKDLMLRCRIVQHKQSGEDQLAIIFTMHHIASDGWSMGVLVKEFMALYEAHRAGNQMILSTLPPLPIQFYDFAYWQRESQNDAQFSQSVDYWLKTLEGIPSLHGLPLDKPRPAKQSYNAQRVTQRINKDLLNRVQDMANEHGVSLFMVLQAAFAALNARYSGENDIVMGVPHGGRKQESLAPLIGFFINTLVFRTQLDDDTTVASLLAQTKKTTLQAFDNDQVPLEQLIEMLNPERTMAYNPVCQIKFILQNHDAAQLDIEDVEFEAIAKPFDKVRFDLDLTANNRGEDLVLSWTFKEDLFEADSIERMAHSFERLLEQMVERPQARLADLILIDASEQQNLLELGQGLHETQHRDVALIKQIEAQASATPNAIATRVVDKHGAHAQLSYAQLNQRAGRLASALSDAGVEEGDRVGIYLSREIELLIAMLAVQKVGACYVMLPLDIQESRLQHMLQDADIETVLRKRQKGLSTLAGVDSVYLDDAVSDEGWLAEYPAMESVDVSLEDSAYVIYTSGSTGKPKGVEVTQQGLNDYCQISRVHHYPGDNSIDNLGNSATGSLVASAVTFDLTIPGLFVPLLQGGCVNLLAEGDELSDLAAVLSQSALSDSDVSENWLIRLTPSHIVGCLPLLADSIASALMNNAQHSFVIGGERFSPELAVALQSHFPRSQIYNHYGPTETVVGATYYDVSANINNLASYIPIGKPLPNTCVLVLDEQLHMVPVGVPGELYIGGARVANGYLNREELTGRHFVENPFQSNTRLYRTGDKVRWLSDGNLAFLGRVDDQVKIRGYRIELGEIEQQLLKVSGVSQAVTKVWGQDSDAFIAAYVSANQTQEKVQEQQSAALNADSIKSALSKQLPDYMIPAAVVVLDDLPRTANGKVDRSKLPEPGLELGDALAVVETQTELKLAEIWSGVLGKQSIGRQSEFFALGGHSLLATRVASDVSRVFGKKVVVSALFEHSRLCDLANYIDSLSVSGYEAIPKASRDTALQVSFAQQRLWFIDQLEGGSTQYNMPFAMRLKGELNSHALQLALNQLVARHEILRTCYTDNNGEALQLIQAPSDVPCSMVDMSRHDANEIDAKLRAIAKQESTQPFDLRSDLMLRVTLVKIASDDHALYLTLHHIASDGWSNGIIIQELSALYGAACKQQEANLPPLSLQYADYALWQRHHLAGSAFGEQLNYWKEHLQGIPAVHSLPLDFPRPAHQKFDAVRYDHVISKDTLLQLKSLAFEQGVTMFMLLQSAFAVLLGRYSAEHDIVMGTPIAGRNHKDVEPLVGFFINTLLLRTDLSDNPDFIALLKQSKTRALAAYENQDVPFDYLVDELKPVRSLSYSPIFQILFTMRNNEEHELSLPGLDIRAIGGQESQSKFDIQLAVEESEQGLRVSWLYNTSLFGADTIAQWASAYTRLLQHVAQAPELPVFNHPLVNDDEREALLALGQGEVDLDGRDTCLIRHIEAQVSKTPDAIAVECGNDRLSYAQLNAKANRLAHRLMAENVQGSRIGIALARSAELMIALLAVQKAGASYVMLPISQAQERVASVLADAGIHIVLQHSYNVESAESAVPEVQTILLDGAATNDEWLHGYSSDNPNDDTSNNTSNKPGAQSPTPDDIAYVLYTSGSTGKPKGVEVTQRGLVDYCLLSSAMHYPKNSDSAGGSFVASNVAFDLTIPGLYVPLLNGGCVTLIPEQDELETLAQALMQPSQIARLIRLTPSHIQGLLLWMEGHIGEQAHSFVIGGEMFDSGLATALQAHFPNARIFNHYGPTETVVGATCYEVSEPGLNKSLNQSSAIPIGTALANTRVYVLDESLQPVPVGMPGELFIGGLRVAKGYLNQPELTQEKFIASPFVQGERLYRTGDKVRWVASGTDRSVANLVFLGRFDEQVKVRGFRIELGEIEHQLLRHPAVEQVVVKVWDEEQQPMLCAYVVANEDITTTALTEFLHGKLPDYMIPTSLQFLTALPLTPNGKVNRKALPAPKQQQVQYVAPQTETEQKLVSIWQTVIGKDNIGVNDNFFAIGGDSILSIQVVSRAAKVGVALTTRQIFENQTIAELANSIAIAPTKHCEQDAITGECELLPIQNDFLLGEQVDIHHFNQAVLLEVPAELDKDSIAAITQALLQRHDALRLRFIQTEEGWKAHHQALDSDLVNASYQLDVAPDDIRFEDYLQQRCDYWQGQFDLEKGPLFRAVLMRKDNQSRLLLAAHHIVVDAVSWRIMLSDTEQAYQQLKTQGDISLAPKTSSFKAFAQGVKAWSQSESLEQQRNYWQSQSQLPIKALPKDRETEGSGSNASNRSCAFQINVEDTALLLNEANQAYRTQINELLLSGVLLGIYGWAGNQGVRIKLEGHGREDISDELDVTETVGWFTTHHPLALYSEKMATGQVIKAVKEQVRAVPMRGFGYGVLQQYGANMENVEPAFTFNYLGQVSQSKDAEQPQAFRFAAENIGATSSPVRSRRHGLVLKGMVANDELRFSLEYSDEQYDAATMTALADHLKIAMQSVIHHCVEVSRDGTQHTYTPSDFPLAKVTQAKLEKWQQQYPELSRLYPATPMQSGLYFHGQIDHSSYITQHYPIFNGDMNVDAFKRAWLYIVERHDTFRTAFVESEDQLHQLVSKRVNLAWKEEDWRAVPVEERAQRFETLRAGERSKGFDFAVAPLMRIVLIRWEDHSYQLLWNHHHMLSDGWSLPQIFKEVMLAYQAFSQGQQPVLTAAPVYQHYIEWLTKQSTEQAIQFWKERLQQVETPTPLVVDKGGVGKSAGVKTTSVTVSGERFAALQRYAQEQRVTINTLIQLAWAYQLHRYSQEKQVILGTTVSGRPAQVPGIEDLVGLFINTIPFTVDFSQDLPLGDMLQKIQKDFQDCNDHSYISLVDIQKQSKLRAGIQLFDSLLVISNYPIEAATSAAKNDSGLEIVDNSSYEETTYKLSFSVGVRQQIHIQCRYQGEAFSDSTIDYLLADFAHILNQLPQAVDKTVQQLQLKSEAEQQTVQEIAPLAAKSVVELFEQQAQSCPQQIAARFGDDEISYAQLNQEANKLARYLIDTGVKNETLVGLSVNRSVEMLIGMLAILKSGAAYIPLDPDYPKERLAFMMEDANVDIILTQQSVMESLAIFDNKTLLQLDKPFRENLWGGLDASNLELDSPLTPNSLAYVIYTSGSTGTPKGVMVEHGNIIRLISNTNYVEYKAGGVMAQASNVSFDAATFEIWGALCNGMVLQYIPKEILLDANQFKAMLHEKDVAILFITTAVFNQMSLVDPKGFATLDYLLFGGEAVDNVAVQRVVSAGKPAHLMHVYGPTENTTFSTAFEIKDISDIGYPIGKSISGSTHYVLDEKMRPVPVGAIGELYLGGHGIARGYLEREQLTAERFVQDRFSVGNRKLYRSGDLVRLLECGNLLFAGRVDDQVKIRGFRIELGEVENHVLAHPQVQNTSVIARNDGGVNRLVGYIVVRNADAESFNAKMFGQELQAYLKRSIPDYMIPSVFIVMDDLPLNANGKIDKAKLPEPNFSEINEYTAPQNETESLLAEIWKDVLRVEQVGTQDNFFEIGGDSILSIQIVSRLNEAGLSISTKQLFELPTIAELAKVAVANKVIQAPQQAIEGEQALLPIHHYFLQGDSVDRHHFNQAVLLTVPESFTREALTDIMAAILTRHDALRLQFSQSGSEHAWTARFAPLTDESLAQSCIVEAVTSLADIEARSRYWQTQFDLATGPLIRAVYFDCSQIEGSQIESANEGRLLLAVHHIVVDGVSWRILLKDIESAFLQWQEGTNIALPAKTSSYQQWAEKLLEYANSDKLQAEKPYWLAQSGSDFGDIKTDLSSDNNGKIESTKRFNIELSKDLTSQLLHQCSSAYHTQINELLLAAVYLGMTQWQDLNGVRLKLEGHGRENLFNDIDLTQTVGWFTSIYPLALYSESRQIGDLIKEIKEQYRAVPNNGIGYGVLKYLDCHSSQDGDIVNIPELQPHLLFNYLGQFDQVINDETQFQAASESIGPQVSLQRQRAALLTLSGKVTSGQLRFALGYSSEHFNEDTMQRLAQAIEHGLHAVIEHCSSVEKSCFTPSDFPLANVDMAQLDEWQTQYHQLENLYPATPMQAGLFYEHLVDKSSYTVQIHPIIRGDLDLNKFRLAWQDVVQRYDILRTAFVGEGDALQQLVLSEVHLPWYFEDWRHLSVDEQSEKFQTFKQEDRAKGFDFTDAPLCRWYVIQLDEDRFQILWSLHHILLDGWSIPVVYRDVIKAYQARLDGHSDGLDVAPGYQRYVQWLANSDISAAEAHWRDMLGDFTAATPLVIEKYSSGIAKTFSEVNVKFTEQETKALQVLAQQQKTTINTLLQWAWGYLLHSYSGEEQVVFGATISGRPAEVEGIEEMVGMFINTIPVKVSFSGKASSFSGKSSTAGLSQEIQRLHQSFQSSNEFGYLSILQIQQQSGVRLGQSLFDSILVFENYPIDVAMRDNSKNAPFEVESLSNTESTTFKLSVVASLRLTLNIKFGYRSDCFDKSAIERLSQHMKHILLQLPEAIQHSSEYDALPEFLTKEEYALHQKSCQPVALPHTQYSMHHLFEQAAEQYADNVALWHDGLEMTYAELNAKANQLAHYLRQKGVGKESLVAICLPRNCEVIIGILAILKAGGAYIPIDPASPQSRIDYIAKDSGFTFLLTDSNLAAQFASVDSPMLRIDELAEELEALPQENLALVGESADQLIYIIYTSGTTGNPKGVLITHAKVTRLFLCTVDQFNYSDKDVWTLFHSTAFDASVWEIWGALLHGAKLVIPTYAETRDPAKFVQLCDEQGVTSLTQTPSAFKAVSQAAFAGNHQLKALKYIVMCGEALKTEDLLDWWQRYEENQPEIFNMYGITEITVHATFKHITKADLGVSNIGLALADLPIYLLDSERRFVPIGVPGEIYVGGAGVANGYLNKPELTAERFTENPYATPEMRQLGYHTMYKSGDLARITEDGELIYMGRNDEQVKIRGFRIELGEIESQLNLVPQVVSSLVIAKEDARGDKILIAYVVPTEEFSGEHEAQVKQLRQHLFTVLPDYMVPATIIALEQWPLTVNGKIDKKALPDPDFSANQEYLAPETETEKALTELWGEVLNLDAAEISVTSSFFELGGHSLLVARLSSKLNRQFSIELSVINIFSNPTIRALATVIDEMISQQNLKQELTFDMDADNAEEFFEL